MWQMAMTAIAGATAGPAAAGATAGATAAVAGGSASTVAGAAAGTLARATAVQGASKLAQTALSDPNQVADRPIRSAAGGLGHATLPRGGGKRASPGSELWSREIPAGGNKSTAGASSRAYWDSRSVANMMGDLKGKVPSHSPGKWQMRGGMAARRGEDTAHEGLMRAISEIKLASVSREGGLAVTWARGPQKAGRGRTTWGYAGVSHDRVLDRRKEAAKAFQNLGDLGPRIPIKRPVISPPEPFKHNMPVMRSSPGPMGDFADVVKSLQGGSRPADTRTKEQKKEEKAAPGGLFEVVKAAVSGAFGGESIPFMPDSGSEVQAVEAAEPYSSVEDARPGAR